MSTPTKERPNARRWHSFVAFPVSTKDYRLWRASLLPVFLILYDALVDEAYWLDVQDYATTQPPDPKGKSVRLRIPRQHVVGVQTIRLMRQRRQQRIREIRSHLQKVT